MSEKFLLNELTSNADDRIKDAINRVLRVHITYNDNKPNVISNKRGYNTRYILPVAYGLTKKGEPAIRAFQTAGSTKRGVPKWKLFLLKNIVSWNNSKKSFKQYKDDLIKLGLNTSGDKGMTTIFAITPFADGNVQVKTDSNNITSEPLTKNDITPKTSSQTPKINSTNGVEKLEPAKNKRISSIDKTKDKSYFDNKVEAPATKPVTKTDIDGSSNVISNNNSIDNLDKTIPTTEPTTLPITKKDIETSEIENNPEKVKNNFNSFMDRMNNIYKEKDEEIE